MEFKGWPQLLAQKLCMTPRRCLGEVCDHPDWTGVSPNLGLCVGHKMFPMCIVSTMVMVSLLEAWLI